MIRPFSKISIQQVTPYSFIENGVTKTRERNELFDIDFATFYEIEAGWQSHTNNASIDIAKNILLKNDDALFSKSGSYNVILGSGSTTNVNQDGTFNTISPLIMRGDIVYISDGYYFMNEKNQQVIEGKTHFSGYVSKVHSDIPIKIELEDNFYLLKHVPVGRSTYTGNLIELCKYMVGQVNAQFNAKNSLYPALTVTSITDSITANFSLGFLDIGDITCAELLSRLRFQYKLESNFMENELHFGFPIYDESKAITKYFFEFQNNIFDGHSLEYKSKQDIILSAVVSCESYTIVKSKTFDGQDKTKKERKSILIYWDIPSETFKFIDKKKGEPLPVNTGGERHDFKYPVDPKKPEPSSSTLFDFGKKQLQKYFYTGFRGSFTTFGFPFVEWGDNVIIVDKVMSDRNGVYKVKKVVRTGGVGGIQQEIHLDYKLNIPVPDAFDTIYMI